MRDHGAQKEGSKLDHTTYQCNSDTLMVMSAKPARPMNHVLNTYSGQYVLACILATKPSNGHNVTQRGEVDMAVTITF